MTRRRRTVVRLKPQALWDRLALLHRSQNWLADELGISRSHLSRLVNWERATSGSLRRRMQRSRAWRTSMSCSTSSAPIIGSSPSPQPGRGGPQLVIANLPFLDGSGVLPDDFPECLDRLRRATGLTRNGFADALGADRKQALRWNDGTEPCGGAMLSIVRLAGVVPGGLLDLIMGDGFLASLWRPESMPRQKTRHRGDSTSSLTTSRSS